MTFVRFDSLEPRRLMAAGQNVASFGGDGDVLVQMSVTKFRNNAFYEDIAVDGKQRVLVGGITDKDHRVAISRLKSDGSLDKTFGKDGLLSFASPGIDRRNGTQFRLAIDSKNRVVVLASTYVFRVTESGILDKSFDKDGQADVPVVKYTNAIAVDASDRPVIAGVSEGKTGDRGTVLRLSSTGTLDKSFADNGAYKRPVPQDRNYQKPGNSTADAVRVLPDGRILAVGGVTFATDRSNDAVDGVEAWRLTGNGVLDAKYGRKGVTSIKTETAFGSDAYADNSFAAFGPDGSVYTRLDISPGQDQSPKEGQHVLTRIDPTGSIPASDTHFDPVPTRITTDPDSATTIVPMSDNRLVVYSAAAPALYRLDPGHAVDETFAIRRESFGLGRPSASHMILAGDRVYVLNERGIPFNTSAYPKFSVTAIAV